MKKAIIIFFIFSFSFGCSRFSIPKQIIEQQKQWIERTPARSHEYDVELSPIETTPVMANTRSLNTGNWGYSYLKVNEYEDFLRTNAKRKVEVFIFDTGGDYKHNALAPHTRGGRSFTGETLEDGNGHSIHVAGTYVASKAGTDIGICKVLAEKGLIKVRPYKVLTNSGSGSYSNITRAIKAANIEAKKLINDGYFVIYNFSLGGSSANNSMDAALKESKDLGVLISMAATGNTGREGVNYPGKSEYTQGIGAHDSRGRKAGFSTTGEQVVFSFPGQSIYSTYKNNTYRFLSGTSMATPHAGAFAALVASVYPEASADQVIAHMIKHANDKGAKGRDKDYGFGTPDAKGVFSEAPKDEPKDEPDDKPDDEPDDQPDDEPDDEPEYPSRTQTYMVDEWYTIRWRTRDDAQYKQTPVKLTIEYKHRKSQYNAVDDITEQVRKNFLNRGYVLSDESEPMDAVYWSAFFFKLSQQETGLNMKVLKADYKVSGVITCLDDFEKRPTAKKATLGDAIQFPIFQGIILPGADGQIQLE